MSWMSPTGSTCAAFSMRRILRTAMRSRRTVASSSSCSTAACMRKALIHRASWLSDIVGFSVHKKNGGCDRWPSTVSVLAG